MNLWKRALVGLFLSFSLTSAQAATPDDQLIIALKMNNILSLDPAAATGNDIAFINANIYDTLIELDPFEPTRIDPGLAEKWEIDRANNRIIFSMRRGAKFHSGNPVDAEDVVWSIQRVMRLNMALSTTWKAFGYTQENIADLVNTDGRHSVIFELPSRIDYKLFLYTLATSPSAFVLDKDLVLSHEIEGDLGNQWLTTHAAGSGAYKLEKWIPQDRITMTKNNNYWRQEAEIGRIVMRNLKESQTMRLMIERGDIDVAIGMSVPDIRSLENSEDVNIQTTQRGTLYYVAVSMQNPTLSDPKVRRAIRGAIDYEGINESIMPYYGEFHQRPIKKGLPATLPDPNYSMSDDQARSLLSRAGYDNGFSVTIRSLNESPFINVATNLQSSLAAIGIDASIITGTGNQIYGAMRNRSFDIIVGRGGGGIAPHPDSNLRPLLYNPDNTDEAQLTNFQGWRTSYQNEEINTLINRAIDETDDSRQQNYYQEIQRIYDEDIGALFPFSQMVNTVVIRDEVNNYFDDPAAMTRFRKVNKTSP